MQAAPGHLLSQNIFWVEARGDSMRPFLSVRGPALPFIPAAPGNFRAGDVVLYGGPEASAVHRVLWKTRRGAWITDDAGRAPMHFVEHSLIRGRLIKTCPQGPAGLALGLACRAFFIGARAIQKIFSA
jgi:hypothetical protein